MSVLQYLPSIGTHSSEEKVVTCPEVSVSADAPHVRACVAGHTLRPAAPVTPPPPIVPPVPVPPPPVVPPLPARVSPDPPQLELKTANASPPATAASADTLRTLVTRFRMSVVLSGNWRLLSRIPMLRQVSPITERRGTSAHRRVSPRCRRPAAAPRPE